MELKTFGIEFGAIMVSYLLLMLPVVGATDVNIMFGGEVKDTTEISPSKIVNRVIEVVHDPTDITWANVKVRVSVSSASLAKSIDKIYLFTCKNQNPVDCVKGKPLEFENYIDEELNWVDISAQTGAGFYPQTANILLLVKLQGERTTWTGFWDKIERLDYNVFGTYSYEISSINVDAKSLDLVAPIKAYIQNYQMIPFTWVNQVYFEGANFLYSVGADEDEIEKVQNLVWHTAQPETNYITSVAKELSFLLPVTASGINNIVPVNKNPSYVCGNGVCEADLGETFDNCCHDCVCEAGKYCDLPEGSTAGTCRSIEQTELEIISPTPQITDCTQPFNVNLEVRVKNPPMSLGKEATATITINDTAYPVVCTKMAGGYSCPLTLKPWVGCGAASYTVGPNHIDLIVTYKNGPNDVTKDFSEDFDDLSANFNCPCTQEGYYCESGSKTCRPLGSISLGIVSVKSYFTTFNPAGDNIDLTLQVNNPPGDLGITGTTYILGGLYQNGGMLLNETSGTITCEGGSDSGFVYNCSIPFSITNYNHENAYYWKQNSITFDVSFSSGGQTITQELTTAFSDVTIPSHRCGDGTCNPEEDMVSCCFDCGCESDEYFCDKERGCKTMDSLRLEVSTVYPNQFDDCRKQHIVNMTAQIKNIPSDANLDYFNYIRGEEISGWTIECPQPNTDTGITNCRLFIPPIENCTIPAERIGPNELSLTISFGDGPRKTAKTMEDEFTDIYVRAIPKCGDGICETNLDESEETCCIDCLDDCIDRYNGEGYCDIPDPNFPEEGECKDKGDVQLRVIAPLGTTTFDSCEKTNRLSVRARIDGLPSDAQIGNWWAEVNGSSRSISCNQEQSFIGIPTWTFNCSIPVSGVAGCKSGSSFTLPNNMLHVYLSFSNGRISMEKNTTFGNILLRQKYKTILEITREALEKSNATMRSILDKKKEMVENMKECAEMMKKLMIVSIVLGVVGAMGWLGPATSTTAALFGGKGMTGGIMGSLISGYQKWCEWQQKELENLIELEKMELCEIQMNLCMQTAQYALDAGNCGEIDIRCFQNQYSSMQSCTDTGMSCIDKSFQKISSNMQQMGTLAQGIVQDVQNFGAGIRALGTETDFGDAKLLIDGRPMSTDKICGVRYQRAPTTITAVGVVLGAEKETTIGARQNSGAVACPNLVFKLDGGETQKWPTDVKGTTREFFGVDAQGVHNIQVFCRESAVARATPVGGPIKVCFCNGGPITVGGVQYIGCTEENCKDAWSECTGSTPQATQLGQIPAPSATRSTGPGGLTANVEEAQSGSTPNEQIVKKSTFKVTPTTTPDVTDVVVHLDGVDNKDVKYTGTVGPDGKANFPTVVEGVYNMYVTGKNKTSGQAVSSQNTPVRVLVDLHKPSISTFAITPEGTGAIKAILNVADSLGEGGTCTITWKGKTSNVEKNPATVMPFTGKAAVVDTTVTFSLAEGFQAGEEVEATAVCKDKAGRESDPYGPLTAKLGDTLAENPTPSATGVTLSSTVHSGQTNPVKGEASTFDVPIANTPKVGSNFEVQFSWSIEPSGQVQSPTPEINKWVVVPAGTYQPKFTPTQPGTYRVTVRTRLNNTNTGVAEPADTNEYTITVDKGREPVMTIPLTSRPTISSAGTTNTGIEISFSEKMDHSATLAAITVDGIPVSSMVAEVPPKATAEWADIRPRGERLAIKFPTALSAGSHQVVIGTGAVTTADVPVSEQKFTVQVTAPAGAVAAGDIVVTKPTQVEVNAAKNGATVTWVTLAGTTCNVFYKKDGVATFTDAGASTSAADGANLKHTKVLQSLDTDSQYSFYLVCTKGGVTSTRENFNFNTNDAGPQSLTAAAPPGPITAVNTVLGFVVDDTTREVTTAAAATDVPTDIRWINITFSKDVKSGEESKVVLNPDIPSATRSVVGKQIVFRILDTERRQKSTPHTITVPAGLVGVDNTQTASEVVFSFVTASDDRTSAPTEEVPTGELTSLPFSGNWVHEKPPAGSRYNFKHVGSQYGTDVVVGVGCRVADSDYKPYLHVKTRTLSLVDGKCVLSDTITHRGDPIEVSSESVLEPLEKPWVVTGIGFGYDEGNCGPMKIYKAKLTDDCTFVEQNIQIINPSYNNRVIELETGNLDTIITGVGIGIETKGLISVDYDVKYLMVNFKKKEGT